jgi:hypothetical protein
MLVETVEKTPVVPPIGDLPWTPPRPVDGEDDRPRGPRCPCCGNEMDPIDDDLPN